jgi:hypothetical protein
MLWSTSTNYSSSTKKIFIARLSPHIDNSLGASADAPLRRATERIAESFAIVVLIRVIKVNPKDITL